MAGCDEDNVVEKTSCDFDICEEGRNVVDSLQNEIGILQKMNDTYVIEVTSYRAIQYKTQCNPLNLDLPEDNSYVRFDADIKERCDDKGELISSLHYQEIVLQRIEVITVETPMVCDGKMELFVDDSNIDPQLQILNLNIKDDCLFILVSYVGGCNQPPAVVLLYPDIKYLSYPIMIEPALEGKIIMDCQQTNYQLLRFNLEVLAQFYDEPKFIMEFRRNGGQGIFYNP